ncbi:AAA family ATPase [Flavobacterium sp. CBA20B-1]|uniref:AAA family ATPase n=1 Tax=unclassified Flavobacterium TaxID=196869 RepID=UPI0022252EA1|nr:MULTISPECIES: AAA family ATPase [unclassified Flavobacterium]WCM41940.1 AAA family ATPase [Flavobacterium sp. CBA20B-1]
MKKILFYDKEDFYDYRESMAEEGLEIFSVSKYTRNPDLITDIDSDSEIIDLSVLTEYDKMQFVIEQFIVQFSDGILFICDSLKRNIIEYELRFVFDEFGFIDKKLFVTNKESSNEETTHNKIEKKHRKIIDLTDDELSVFLDDFNNGLYGHPKFKDDFAEQIRTFRIFNRLKEHKVLSLFLMGDSGVGKTEVARTIFKCLKGNKRLAKINFGNYSSEFSLSSLIGASRGYRDSEDGEIFMKVRDSDVGVLLIDEFEKSNSALFNYFLNVLETGVIEGSLGQQIDLNGFIIIFTSNISKEDFQKRISPELKSRFDYKCMFTLLGDKDKGRYIEFRVQTISKKVNIEFGVEIETDLQKFMSQEINVSLYNNMRDLNKKIKKKFLEFTVTFLSQNKEVTIEDPTKYNWKRKFLNLF